MPRTGIRGGALAAALVVSLAACAEDRGAGAQCAFNDDCASPLVCAASRCRNQCRTDRDCPNGQLCAPSDDPRKRVCIPAGEGALCDHDRLCPAGALCVASTCWWQCRDDGLCADRNAGACLRPERVCAVPVTARQQREAPDELPDGGAAPPDAATGIDATTTDAPLAPLAPDAPFAPDAPAPTDVHTTTDLPAAPDVARSPCEVMPDGDGDRYRAAACGGPDCDDARGDVHPGAPERCDGVDNDCDGMTDEEGAALCALSFATARCAAGACAVASCSPGWGDCDQVSSNGCEAELASSATHCGACGRLCALGPNTATMTCAAGACALGTCLSGFGDCDGMAANGCEHDLRRDPLHCGACNNRCSTRPHAQPACADAACAITCDAGWADCNGNLVDGCEVELSSDRAHCGRCGSRCAVAGDACVAGSCQAHPSASTGAEGAFAPTPSGDAGVSVVRLAAGVHHFTSVRIPAGVTVITDGDGVLEIRATDDVVIDGTVDVSGGRGGDGVRGTACGGAGGGGATGAVDAPGATGVPNGMAGVVNCVPAGRGGAGASGGNGVAAPSACGAGISIGGGGLGGLGGAFGGGSGGNGATGGGGGGVAGGAGGHGQYLGAGGAGASVAGFGVGGPNYGQGGEIGNTAVNAVYRGGGGSCGTTAYSAGGGGSIGARAANDLAVRDAMTFRAGSGGGGGAAHTAGCGYPSGGGGGGGGALRIASPSRIVVRGAVFARGGNGGNGAGGSAGGGGSGGLIYLSAPAIEVTSGVLSVGGGRGGGAVCNGGDGGLGRLRLSVLPARCSLTGAWTPPLPTGGCVPTVTPTPGQVFIGTWPD